MDTIAVRVRGVGRVRPRHFADDDDASLAARRRHPGARVSVERVRSPGESTKRHSVMMPPRLRELVGEWG